MQCESFDIGVQCPAPATVEVFWPGKTTKACDRHAKGISGLAGAMGFSVDVRPIVDAVK